MADLIEENRKLKADNELLRKQLETMRVAHESLVVRLTSELAILQRRVFGQKAERLRNAEAQQSFLDILLDLGLLKAGDVEAGARAEAMLGDLRDEEETSGPTPDPDKDARRKKKKTKPHGRRKPEDSKVPIERIVLEPVERSMPGGDALQRIGEETTSYLDHRPGSVVRVDVIRPKYMRPQDVGTSSSSALTAPAVAADPTDDSDEKPAALVKILVADAVELPIPRGLAGAALLAYVLVMKYADHIPLHRMERIFLRDGVHLARSTLCGFVQGSVALLRHVVDAMWVDAKCNSALLLTDACGVLIRNKERCRRGHFQVFIAPGRHVFFAYLKENNGAAVAALLKGFVGKLQSDASAVYHEAFRREPNLIEVGCWAHARRGLYNALVSARDLALVGIGFISELYDAQDQATDPVTGLVDGAKRRELALPVLTNLAAWIKRERPRCARHLPIETALGYIERQWIPLTRFLDDGALRLDNNPSELALRHQKVGENNWIFCATDGGAEWNATVVSLIASCRMHNVEPYAYLRDVLTLLPAWPQTRALELAPASWKETSQRSDVLEQLKRLQPFRQPLAHADVGSSSARV